MRGELAFRGVRKSVAEPAADERRDEHRDDDPADEDDIHPIQEMCHRVHLFCPGRDDAGAALKIM